MVKIVWRESAPILVEIVGARLDGSARWPHQNVARELVGFLHIASGTCSNNIIPCRESALRSGQDMVKR